MDHKQGAAEKKWNLQSFPAGYTIFNTNQTYIISCAGDNTFMSIHEGDIILSLTINNLPLGSSYDILKPSLNWVMQCDTTIQFITSEGPKIIDYNGYNLRGEAGHLLELLEYSKPKWDMYSDLEFLEPKNGLTSTTFDVVIPLKFLIDPAYDDKLLNIDYVKFSISWQSQDSIFQFDNTLPLKPSVQCNKVDIKYPTITTSNSSMIAMIDRQIPNRQIYVQKINLLPFSDSANAVISVPFPASVLYYFFKSTDNVSYNMNPNPNSVVTLHALTAMGNTYPLVTNYGVHYQNGVVEVGMKRHYLELMDIINKDCPEKSNQLSYSKWRDQYRVYAIEIGTEQHMGQQYTFTSNFTNPTSVSEDCILIFIGRRLV